MLSYYSANGIDAALLAVYAMFRKNTGIGQPREVVGRPGYVVDTCVCANQSK